MLSDFDAFMSVDEPTTCPSHTRQRQIPIALGKITQHRHQRLPLALQQDQPTKSIYSRAMDKPEVGNRTKDAGKIAAPEVINCEQYAS